MFHTCIQKESYVLSSFISLFLYFSCSSLSQIWRVFFSLRSLSNSNNGIDTISSHLSSSVSTIDLNRIGSALFTINLRNVSTSSCIDDAWRAVSAVPLRIDDCRLTQAASRFNFRNSPAMITHSLSSLSLLSRSSLTRSI